MSNINNNEDGQLKKPKQSNVGTCTDEFTKKCVENSFNNNDNGNNELLTQQNNINDIKLNKDFTSRISETCVSIASITEDTILSKEETMLSFEKTNFELSVDSSCVSSVHQDVSQQPEKETCSCDNYKAKREMFKEELQKAMKFQNLWTELRQHIRSAFNKALKASHGTDKLELQDNALCLYDMRDTVIQLCERDPQQLFMRLVSQAQEFVIEVKVRLLAVLHERTVNNFAEIFLTGFLGDYNALMSTAIQISQLVKPLIEHLCIFNLTWDCFIKKLYQIYVYSDPLVQTNLSSFIAQLRDLLPLKGSEYQNLVQRYLAFDDEMTKISELWPETELWMDKYNSEQAVRMTRLKQIREAWKIYTATRKLMEQRISNKLQDGANESEFQNNEEQVGQLVSQEKTEISETDSIFDFTFDSPNIPPSIEIVQILLDDGSKVQHQKLAKIVVALATAEMGSEEHSSTDNRVYDETNNQLAQFAINAISREYNKEDCRKHNEVVSEKCKCHPSELPSSRTIQNLPSENGSVHVNGTDFLPPLNGFTDEMNCLATHILKNLNTQEVDNNIKENEQEAQSEINEELITCENEEQPCSCVYQHARDIIERKREFFENPPCPCLLNSKRKWTNCPCLSKLETETVMTSTSTHSIPQVSVASTPNAASESSKIVSKSSTTTQCVQTQTRHSTTQTTSVPHNHSTHQGTTYSQTHGSVSSDTTKNAGPSNKSHSHSHTQHACHKQSNIEHIKRVSCNEFSSTEGDCSDTGSSQGDSCSTSSSAQRDSSRHCDCCYCEVFGHGMASVTPVSRNYNEMRERLRQLLTKKKAKKCKVSCSPPKSPVKSTSSNTDSECKIIPNTTIPRSVTPISITTMPQQDERNLAELLDFIEGNHSSKKDNKKAEKKARQKQRKLEEKLKKEKQESDRQKLIELQKKTPEVTITVVDPQKPVPQKLRPKYNLPEISILPTSSFTTTPSINNRRKDKDKPETTFNNGKTSISTTGNVSSKGKLGNSNANAKNKGNAGNEKPLKIPVSSQKNKPSTKEETTGLNKSSKSLTVTSETNIKNNTISLLLEKKLANELDETQLTKKERKKLRREMRKLEEAKEKQEKAKQLENQPQIVTIKRVMESNSSEPTVTITLKGQTPAEDKVLFTLINGQTKEASPQKVDFEQGQNSNGKKKKNKGNGNPEKTAKSYEGKTQCAGNVKQQQQQAKIMDNKNLKQINNNDKSKSAKQTMDKKIQQYNGSETKTIKSKKERKNTDNKENIQQNIVNKGKNQPQSNHNNNNNNKNNTNNNNNNNNNNSSKKKQNKINIESQKSMSQKVAQNATVMQEMNTKKLKSQQDKKDQLEMHKITKTDAVNEYRNKLMKNGNQKSQIKLNQSTIRQITSTDIQRTMSEQESPSLSSQFKEISGNTKISIENLKLPPGITITKVDAPVKPLPIRSTLLTKPPANPSKQTTIIATPMNVNQSNYSNPQAGGNVIVVDTGKLKQDLLPKSDKNTLKDTQCSQLNESKKKKKKKNKNANASGSTGGNNLINITPVQNNDFSINDHSDEPAKILHNPVTKMVTIRNPAFGPMKVSPTQQAAIIKVSENGMVTIRSPALQQAINAGLATPPKPDFIDKSDLLPNKATTMDSASTNIKSPSCILPHSFAELRNRLSPDMTTLPGFANIQISKVTNGQSIPENGINLKGTSVTLTKVRSEPNAEDAQQARECTAREAVNGSVTVSGSGKSKKKKKRNGGARQSGDDWNLVESVFTPKDIDLEDGEMDDAERELEAFKRFCLQSVPPPRKEKVNLNIKDIVLKKKSSSSTANTVIAAN